MNRLAAGCHLPPQEPFRRFFMVRSKATTVQEYLDELPEDRRAVISAVRKTILRHLPRGYREALSWGVISYEIPLERFPDTYNGHPLSYVALAAQKNHYALYLMGLCLDTQKISWLKGEFKKAGKKLDMGKACLRFRRLEDLPLEAIGQAIAGITVEDYLARYEASRQK
jgi:hypothetical protein